MNQTPLPEPVVKDFKTDRSHFLELYGSLEVMNNYLKIAVLCLSLVCVGLIVLNIRNSSALREHGLLVVGIDTEGRPHVLASESVEFHPQERELRFFLTQFVQDHYNRMRATAKESYARSLYFLEGSLVDALIESTKNSKNIESFLAGQGEENDVKIINVSIEDPRTSPYRATVDFEKVFFRADHQESRREKYTANFQFIVKDHVPNDFIPVNPLGLTITYFREDQSFNR